MTKPEAPSGRRVVHNTGFALADLVLTKLGNVAVFVLLVRLLSGPEIAAIGVAGGYIVFVAWLDVSPVRVLLRDYPRVAADRAARDSLFSGMAWFFLLQVAAIALLAAVLQATLIPTVRLPGVDLLFWAMAIDFVALAFQDWIKMVFFADLRQSRATVISTFVGAARLCAYALLLLDPSLGLYSALLALTALAAMVVWAIAFRRAYPFRLAADRKAVRAIARSVTDYGLWDHLNRMSIDTLLLIDTVILSWLALYAGLDAYTIALRFTSMLFLVPNQIRRGLQLGLSYARDAGSTATTYGAGILANTVVSLGQLFVIWLAGPLILHLLFGAAATEQVFRLTLIITVGATILNLVGPLIAAANNLCSLREMFLRAFLPSAVIGTAGYLVLGWRFGTIGVAYGNIFAYTVLAAAVALFSLSRLSLRPNFGSAVSAIPDLFRRAPAPQDAESRTSPGNLS